MREDELDLIEALPAAPEELHGVCPSRTTVAEAMDKYDGGRMPTCGSW